MSYLIVIGILVFAGILIAKAVSGNKKSTPSPPPLPKTLLSCIEEAKSAMSDLLSEDSSTYAPNGGKAGIVMMRLMDIFDRLDNKTILNDQENSALDSLTIQICRDRSRLPEPVQWFIELLWEAYESPLPKSAPFLLRSGHFK